MFDFEEIEFPETMGASIHVPINPELLIWARESAGYDTSGAAIRLGVSNEKLESIEAGEAQITYVQLRKAAEVYKRSLAAFFMASPPPRKEPPTPSEKTRQQLEQLKARWGHSPATK